jgi:hypothetical protein
MKPVRTQIFLRRRWFVVSVHAALWLLLYCAVVRLGGKTPDFHDAVGLLVPTHSALPAARLEALFTPAAWPKTLSDTNSLNPFFTRHFTPSPAPPAPPPTTRKIELTYQGFYETEGGPKNAIVKLGDSFLVAPMGSKLTANLYAAQASMQSLILTNPAAQTNILSLNAKKEVEVPVQ